MIPKIISVKYLATVAAAALAIGLGLGAWGGYAACSSLREGKVARANAALEVERAERASERDVAERREQYCASLDALSQERDAAVAAMAAQSAQAAEAAEVAAAAARAQSGAMQAAAARVMAAEPPNGDRCVAATNAFDDELRAERKGKKP